jgi:hypothetical protein
LAAALCVIWSLCVLIERSAEEVSEKIVNGTAHCMYVCQSIPLSIAVIIEAWTLEIIDS